MHHSQWYAGKCLTTGSSNSIYVPVAGLLVSKQLISELSVGGSVLNWLTKFQKI